MGALLKVTWDQVLGWRLHRPGGRSAGAWELAGTDVAVTLFPEAEQPPAGALQAEADRVAQACGLSHLTVCIA